MFDRLIDPLPLQWRTKGCSTLPSTGFMGLGGGSTLLKHASRIPNRHTLAGRNDDHDWYEPVADGQQGKSSHKVLAWTGTTESLRSVTAIALRKLGT
jgi:hypothetical protein